MMVVASGSFVVEYHTFVVELPSIEFLLKS